MLFNKAFPAIFIVTNNADAGAGTLREALTLANANGSATTDYINFNFADISPSGRTITLTSLLPEVSSNLVIDGSTQTGAKFGVSDAKVALVFQIASPPSLIGLKIYGQENVQIYGLYINNITNFTTGQNFQAWDGIQIKFSKNIQIGAVGKGNVVVGFYSPLEINPIDPNDLTLFTENLVVKDNIFGLEADGQTLSVTPVQNCTFWYLIGQVIIGGTLSEGNLFAQGLKIIQNNNSNSTDPADRRLTTPADIQIKNNKIGLNYNTDAAIILSNGLQLTNTLAGGKNAYHIEDNIIYSGNYAIFVLFNAGPIYMLRNYIGIDKSKQHTFASDGIFIGSNTEVHIGDNDPANANFITGRKPIDIFGDAKVSVNKNSIFCITNTSPMHSGFPSSVFIPSISILNITSTSIKGTATPNSSVELFYSDHCGTCSPETYFASVTADNNGNWQYNGSITGTVIASATINGSTSEFTALSIDFSNIKIINTCNGLGSITGVVPQSAVSVKWVDINGGVIGTSADLLNVPAGKYKLQVQNGTCSAESSYYEIATSIQIISTNINIKNSFCNDGQITGLTVNNFASGQPKYSWKNSNGTEVANTVDLKNVPGGVYTFTATIADGTCSKTYGPVTIQNIGDPNITPIVISGAAVIINDQCEQKAGSINLNITGGVAPYKYTWTDAGNNILASTPNISGLGAGTYTLTVTDASPCSIFSINYTLQNEDVVLPQPSVNNASLCGYGIAILSVNNVSANYKYRLYDAANSVTPLADERSGRFTVNVKNSRSYYITQYTGQCESTKAEVKVSVGISSYDIANTFTPNGDGINDYWKITGIENAPNATVQVFNRYGQKVFESKGYSKAFDGTFNGKILPVGTYYYIINMSSTCNILSGSINIIR